MNKEHHYRQIRDPRGRFGHGRGRSSGRGRGRGRGSFQKQRFIRTPPPYSLAAPTPAQRRAALLERNKEKKHCPNETDYLTIAVEGCAHGALDQIYEAISAEEARTQVKVDLLICCGDFQALRNELDFATLAVPDKFKVLGDFHKYYSGEKKAPVPTLFIGGNHEASAYMQELFYGGWAAENVYFMGAANCIQFGGVRIAGLSGIFKERDHDMGRYEVPPYDASSLRSVYHVRNVEVYRLAQLLEPIDVMISHDWPRGITNEKYGNVQDLMKKKPFFRQEIEKNALGSPANEFLLHTLQPTYWFSAHLHVKFQAAVQHVNEMYVDKPYKQSPLQSTAESPKKMETTGSTEFVGLESDGQCITSLTQQMTKFLSLDKCLPRRQFLQILKVPRPSSESGKKPKFRYDLEWLTLLRKTHHLSSSMRRHIAMPMTAQPVSNVEKEETLKLVSNHLPGTGHEDDILCIPSNFQVTAPPHPIESKCYAQNNIETANPQTDQILSMLNLTHIITKSVHRNNDMNEIDLESDIDERNDDSPLFANVRNNHTCDDENEIVLSDGGSDGSDEVECKKRIRLVQ